MAVYIVAYDLNKESNRPEIVKDIKTKAWAMLSESSYAIDTEETPEQVYNRLKKHVDSDDRIYIISLKRPYSGFGPEKVNSWLEERLEW